MIYFQILARSRLRRLMGPYYDTLPFIYRCRDPGTDRVPADLLFRAPDSPASTHRHGRSGTGDRRCRSRRNTRRCGALFLARCPGSHHRNRSSGNGSQRHRRVSSGPWPDPRDDPRHPVRPGAEADWPGWLSALNGGDRLDDAGLWHRALRHRQARAPLPARNGQCVPAQRGVQPERRTGDVLQAHRALQTPTVVTGLEKQLEKGSQKRGQSKNTVLKVLYFYSDPFSLILRSTQPLQARTYQALPTGPYTSYISIVCVVICIVTTYSPT